MNDIDKEYEDLQKLHLTVGALKRLLADVDDSLFVWTEGCDCVGPSDGVTIDVDRHEIIINRNDKIPRV